jgi:signal transduction histidine kinase
LKIYVKQADFQIPTVWCDIKRITDVVSNLLDNAVFYTYKGEIMVSYDLAADFLKINVKDTGNGISEEDKKKLFQKFTRGTGASGMHPDGSGLGLLWKVAVEKYHLSVMVLVREQLSVLLFLFMPINKLVIQTRWQQVEVK